MTFYLSCVRQSNFYRSLTIELNMRNYVSYLKESNLEFEYTIVMETSPGDFLISMLYYILKILCLGI